MTRLDEPLGRCVSAHIQAALPGWYADHHFHYGYLTYAAATLARLDVPYWDANKVCAQSVFRRLFSRAFHQPILTPIYPYKLGRDGHDYTGLLQPGHDRSRLSLCAPQGAVPATFTAPTSQPWFVPTHRRRCRPPAQDFFDGHSWASGLFQQANGKGQESSSEAANAYYAGTRWPAWKCVS